MALAAFHETRPALVVLDVMLPGRDGWAVLHDIRMEGETPVIMLTAKGDTGDRVQGLELGADDYISKPFDAKELIARIKAVLRRSAPVEPERTIQLDGLSVSLENYAVVLDGRPLEMPPKEIELLYFLASHSGKVFTREQLLEQVWGFDFSGIPARWTSMSSASAKNWATAIRGSLRPYGASATSLSSNKRAEGTCAAIFSEHCFLACWRRI